MPFPIYGGRAEDAFRAAPRSDRIHLLYPNYLDPLVRPTRLFPELPNSVPNPSSQMNESPFSNVLDIDRGRSGAFRGHFRFMGTTSPTHHGELGQNPQWGLMEDPTDPAWVPAGGPPIQREFDMTDMVLGSGEARDYVDPQHVVAQIRWHIANFKVLDYLRGDYTVWYSDERTSTDPDFMFHISSTVPFKILRTGTYTALETLGWDVMPAYALNNDGYCHAVLHSEEWVVFDAAQTAVEANVPGYTMLGQEAVAAPPWAVLLDCSFDAQDGTAPQATADAQGWGEGGGRSRLYMIMGNDLDDFAYDFMNPLKFVEGRNKFTLWDSAASPNPALATVGVTWGTDAKINVFYAGKDNVADYRIFPARKIVMNVQEHAANISMVPPRGTNLKLRWNDGSPPYGEVNVDISSATAIDPDDYAAEIEALVVAAGVGADFSFDWDAGLGRFKMSMTIPADWGLGIIDTTDVTSAWPWLGWTVDVAYSDGPGHTDYIADSEPLAPVIRQFASLEDRYIGFYFVNRGNVTRRLRMTHLYYGDSFWFERGAIQQSTFKRGYSPRSRIVSTPLGRMWAVPDDPAEIVDATLEFITEADKWLFEQTFIAPSSFRGGYGDGHGIRSDTRRTAPRGAMLMDPQWHPFGFAARMKNSYAGEDGAHTVNADGFESTLYARGLTAGYVQVNGVMQASRARSAWSSTLTVVGTPPGY